MNECAIINLNQISPEKLETRVLSLNRFHAEGLHVTAIAARSHDRARESLNCGHILTNEFTSPQATDNRHHYLTRSFLASIFSGNGIFIVYVRI